MSALAEALVAAQRRALSALQSEYVAGRIEREDAVAIMDAVGLSDPVEQDRLFAALDTIRTLGAALPAELVNGGGERTPDKATDAQLALIAKLVKEKGVTAPYLPVTKQDAHAIIDSLKQGSYDAAKWTVPF